jgi:glycosyltransferase involved in cell wall biosynthesis
VRILFLSRWLPYPPSNGSKIRIYNLLKQIARHGHKVDLITFYQQSENPTEVDEKLKEICNSAEYVLYKPFRPNSKKALLGFFSPLPRSVIDTYQPEMQERVRSMLAANSYDGLVASEIDMAFYGLQAAKNSVPALLEELEIYSIYDQYRKATGLKAKTRSSLTWFKLKNYMRRLSKTYSIISVVSKKEQALVASCLPGKEVAVIHNGTDLDYYPFTPYNAVERAPRLVFNGALTFNLNYEAVSYFVRDIFPLVRKQAPELELSVTGNNNGVNIESLKADGVRFTGYLDDLRPHVAGSAICVAPLLRGGGTRLKILEAFALGTPVVATSKGAEGLEIKNGEHLLVADNPAEFARAVIRLRTEPTLAASLALNARKLVEQQYGWDTIGQTLTNLMEKIKGRL